MCGCICIDTYTHIWIYIIYTLNIYKFICSVTTWELACLIPLWPTVSLWEKYLNKRLVENLEQYISFILHITAEFFFNWTLYYNLIDLCLLQICFKTLIFLFIVGYIFFHFCVPSNFELDIWHCELYLVVDIFVFL